MPLSRIPDQAIDITLEDGVPGATTGFASPPTALHFRQSKLGTIMDLSLSLDGDVTGSPTELTFTLPEPGKDLGNSSAFQTMNCLISEDGGATYEKGVALIFSDEGVCRIRKDGGAAFINNPSTRIGITGRYEIEV